MPRWVPLAAAPAAVLLFIFALRALVLSAAALADVFEFLGADGVLNFIGVGWAGAYAVLSGSPIAATALALLDSGVLTPLEAFGQVVGARMGASFIVLAFGFVYYVRGRRLADSVHVGVIAFLVTISTWIPVAALGAWAIDQGWLDGVDISGATPLLRLGDEVYDPILEPIDDVLPAGLLFILGLFLLLGALRLFDRALPTPEVAGAELARVPEILHGRLPMFLLGALVTLLTFSVAVSLTLLVPLALRGSIRRSAVVPYVLGANVTTFADTLFAAAALQEPAAGTVVLTTMIFAAAIGLAVLALAYRPYVAAVNAAGHWIMRDRRGMIWFIAALLGVPVVLAVV